MRLTPIDSERIYVSLAGVYVPVLCLFVWLPNVCVHVCVCLCWDSFLFRHFIVMENSRQSKSCVRVFVFGIVLEVINWFLLCRAISTKKGRTKRTPRNFWAARALYMRIKCEYCYYTFPLGSTLPLLLFRFKFTAKHQVCILFVGLTDLETVVVAAAVVLLFYTYDHTHFLSSTVLFSIWKKCAIKI